MKLEEDYKTEKGRGTATKTAYSVEARNDYPDPIIIGNTFYDRKWREIQFVETVVNGVPSSRFDRDLTEHNLYGYQAVQALRWWFHAQVSIATAGFCMETRIVKHEFKSSYAIKALSCHEHIHGDDRSNIMPDFGDNEK